MICRICLRQSRAAAASLTRARPTDACGFGPVGRPRRNVQAFSYSSESSSKTKKVDVADNLEEDYLEELESASPFKQQRLRELRQDRESESPLYLQSYPRIESPDTRLSAPEFLEMENDYEPPYSNELQEADDPRPLITLYGRVRAKRVVSGYLMFIDIVNEFRKVQVMVSKDKCTSAKDDVKHHWFKKKFKILTKLIQVGDHISVRGLRFRNEAGQWTLLAKSIPELICPTLEQIPKTLTDSKTKIQERHVDMLVNKTTIDILRLRAAITQHMRDHFHSKRFLEFQTPILAENAGGANARPFATRSTEFSDRELALRVAPELWLKRLVVGGVDKVFEIGQAFRNEGVDATHNPEFTICEFYSAYTNLSDLIKETEELIGSLARHCKKLIDEDLTSLPPIDLQKFTVPFKQIQFIPALEKAMGIRFPKLSAPAALPELLAVLKLTGFNIPGDFHQSLPKLLDRLAAMYLEPKSFNCPILIVNHPACMSPLAKSFLCPETYQLISARAELFVGGREVANMYEEENDPYEQRRKLTMHRNLINTEDGAVGLKTSKDSMDRKWPPVNKIAPTEGVGEEEEEEEEEEPENDQVEPPGRDEEWATSALDRSYIKALDYGLPPTGGWGCGVDRLVMLFSGATRISDCLSFGNIRNVVGLSSPDGAKKKN